MKEHDGRIERSMCGCCADDTLVNIVGLYVLPDGALLHHLQDVDNPDITYWYDPRLRVGTFDA